MKLNEQLLKKVKENSKKKKKNRISQQLNLVVQKVKYCRTQADLSTGQVTQGVANNQQMFLKGELMNVHEQYTARMGEYKGKRKREE